MRCDTPAPGIARPTDQRLPRPVWRLAGKDPHRTARGSPLGPIFAYARRAGQSRPIPCASSRLPRSDVPAPPVLIRFPLDPAHTPTGWLDAASPGSVYTAAIFVPPVRDGAFSAARFTS